MTSSVNKEIKTTHHVLWTGGWDSTYRIVELAREGAAIEPVYVINPGRRSYEIELGRVREIIAMLEEPGRFGCELLPLRIINMEDIPANKKMTEAFNQVKEDARSALNAELGPQYEWLGRLSCVVPDLELCIEAAEPGRLVSRDMIERGSDAAKILWGNFILPIYNKTEQDMLADIRAWGCEDIMQKIWFCNHPLTNGEPCGLCHPCCIKIESGMEILLPQAAIDRNLEMKRMDPNTAKQYRYDLWCRWGIVKE
ncbi:MAG: hypothetical protein KBS56_02930 [Clostridiales bacterium]|nr:hypothetical protein [Candidatus Crickella equi]